MQSRKKHNRQDIEAKNQFLDADATKVDFAQKHKDYLGFETPDNYFMKSKQDILNSIGIKGNRKRTVFGVKSIIAYPLAASLVLIMGVLFWLQNPGSEAINSQGTMAQINVANLKDQDVLISSLLIDDSDVDGFFEDVIVEKIIVEAELSEQKLENLFINSLFVEDSLIDGYFNKGILDNLIL